ncbi:MAG TPA: CDP-alcohol phosphatidyltransferase family protein [Reyranella sp.]|jgi:phosphatidylglycerophosphate synthase
MSSSRGLQRSNSGWLATVEARALDFLAVRLPRFVTPNQLTALGFSGAVLAFVGYALAAHQAAFLWLVEVGLILNWYGDSLDGRVARLRGRERPRYGFFLDQSVDILAQALFSLGLGMSGYIRPEIVAAGFAAYLMMTAQSLLRAHATGVFHLATGGMGLTEVRCLFLVANAVLYFVPPRPFQIGSTTFAYPDLFGVVWILTNIVLYVVAMFTELKNLAREEPNEPESLLD